LKVKQMNERTLVIAAHPDDEVLGCGGTIARLSKEGHEVYVAILGEGITSRYVKRDQADRGLIRDLQDRSQQVSKLLGVKELFLNDLPDNRFDTVPLLDVVKIIEELIDRLQPQAVYTHHRGDLNIDHAITFQATLTATRPIKGCPVREIRTYEIPSSTEWTFGQIHRPFQPNLFVDISKTLDTKIECMKIYESEIRTFPHPRSPEALRAIAQRWGSVVGVESAEAFELIRSIR